MTWCPVSGMASIALTLASVVAGTLVLTSSSASGITTTSELTSVLTPDLTSSATEPASGSATTIVTVCCYGAFNCIVGPVWVKRFFES